MASLSLSVLSTTRMTNCRVGGKNHTERSLFLQKKKKRHFQQCNVTQWVGISGPRASQRALVTAMLIATFEYERAIRMTKDQRHVNFGQMWETPIKPWQRLRKKTCFATWANGSTCVIQPDCDPAYMHTMLGLGMKGWTQVTIETLGLLVTPVANLLL